MKKVIIVCIALVIGVFVMPACKKKKGCKDPISLNYDASAEEDDGSCQYAGTGGNTTIAAFPQHHGKAIWSVAGHIDTAYIKFNAQNTPSSYDLIIAGDSGEDHVHIPNLKPGKYYIYMTGFDTSASVNQKVVGGIPYTLTQTSGEVDVDVPVSE